MKKLKSINIAERNMDEHSRSFQNFLTTANQNRITGMDQEFTELLLKNGNVLMPNPYLRKFPVSINEVKEDPKTIGNSTTQVMEDEMASWFQYPPYEFLEKEFGCDFLCEIPNSQSTITDKPNKSFNPEGNTPTCSNISHKQMRIFDTKQQYVCPDRGGIADFSHFPVPEKIDIVNGKQKQIHAERGESSSMMTVASSICGSNQVQNRVDRTTTVSNNSTISLAPQKLKEDYETSFLSERVHTDTYEVTGTSSSGGSGLSIRAAAQEMSNKRKGQYPEESGSPSEEGDYESADGKKPAQRSRRSRAAEVHNLSERRRRDRINEKMKALQDLIPHCTKSDKASMLDEAIEYLKSLQQQVQMMWMGSSMATMMFPSMQHCMAHMGMGIGRAPMPTLGNLIQIPRVPLVNQPMPSALSANQIPVCPPPMSHLKFPNQMNNSQMPESFAPYLGFQHMQPSHQAVNLYAYGPQMMQQNQMAAIISSSSLPTDGIPPDNLQNDT